MKEQTFTFAVICQVAHLVQKLSRTGQIDDDELTLLLRSITITSPQNTLEVYGGDLKNIENGLTLLVNHLSGKTSDSASSTNKNQNKQNRDPEFTRYIVSILNLERRLAKKPKQLSLLGDRIDQTSRQLDHYDINSETLLASFASIYSDILSPIGTPIQVAGEPTILKQTINQHKIRALLLAGVRATVLWRQVGGQRRKILFFRAKMVNCAEQLLKEM